jgi:hypothetical protein
LATFSDVFIYIYIYINKKLNNLLLGLDVTIMTWGHIDYAKRYREGRRAHHSRDGCYVPPFPSTLYQGHRQLFIQCFGLKQICSF